MTESERTARAALSRLFEPQDAAGLALVRTAGAEDALKIATGQLAAGAELEREIFRLLDENSSGSGWTGLATARQRWAPRVPDLAPATGPCHDAAARRSPDYPVGRTVAPPAGGPRTPGTNLPVVARHRTAAACPREVYCVGWFPGQHLLRRRRHRRPCVFPGTAGVHRRLRRRLRDRCARTPGSPCRRLLRHHAHHRRDGRGSGPLLPLRQRGAAAGRRQPGRCPGRSPAGLGADALQVPAAQPAHRRAGLGHGRRGGPVEVRAR